MLTKPVSESWLSAVDGADEIERKMWQAYEGRFAAAHQESLAWRYVPATAEERAIVEKYFPAERLATKKGDATFDVDVARVHFSEWEAPVSYGTITEWKVRESWGRKFLTIKLNTPARRKVEIPLHRFPAGESVAALFHRYLSRHGVMTQYQAENTRKSA